MMRRLALLLLVMCWLVVLGCTPYACAGQSGDNEGKSAIVLAAFGTTAPEAVKDITAIVDKVRAAYPETEVRLTFTSTIIRSVWKKRRAEAEKWLDLGVPQEVLYVKGIITTLGELQEEGYKNIVVQPTHIFFMEQSYDLLQYVNGLADIATMKEKYRPFTNVVMGRPALGMPGDRYEYHRDVEAAVATLAGDVERARKSGAILVYMGHGNDLWPTGIYFEVQKKMREVYPDVITCVGVVEGSPGIEDILKQLQGETNKKIMLKPFMIVAGDHAVNDMTGQDENSWSSILHGEGYQVQPVLEGLGANDGFAHLFVEHISDAAKERGIVLN